MTQRIVFTFVLAALTLTTLACQGADQPVAKGKAGDLNVALMGPGGQLKKGTNKLTLEFTDAAGKAVDVGSASLGFHMPGMGTMAEMNDKATLTTTGTAGKYSAVVDIEMAGTWEAQVKYEGPNGSGDARIPVQAK